jgi:hypothetical protein
LTQLKTVEIYVEHHQKLVEMVGQLELSHGNEMARTKHVVLSEALARDSLFLKHGIEEDQLYSAA